MKLFKRIGRISLISVVLIILVLALAPVFFKDQITSIAKEQINNNINAIVDFENVNISLLRNFPNVRLGLQQFTVDGKDDFSGFRLAQANSFDVVLDLASVIFSSKPITLKSIYIDAPTVHVKVLEDGKANYDIALPSSDSITTADSESATDFTIALSKYNITDAQIIYDDEATDTYFKAAKLNHSGSGNFTASIYDLSTNTTADTITVVQGGIPYLKNAKIDLDAVLNIDQEKLKYTLKNNQLKINQLLVNADGFVQLLEEEQINLDFTFNTPQNDFKDLLSMIPNAFIEGYENVKAEGDFALNGMIKGVYDGAKEKYPAFNVDLKVANGNVKYPDLPLGITGINTSVKVESPTSNLDKMTIDAQQFALKVGKNPFQGKFKLTTPISDPNLNGAVKGRLDLKELADAFPMEGMEEMSGIIDADVKANARMSLIEKGQYDQVDMSGFVKVDQLVYDDATYPKVVINQAETTFSPKQVNIKSFDAKLGKSDLQANGSIDNILAYFSPRQTMKGNLRVTSHLFDANEWYIVEEETSTETEENAALSYGSAPEAETPYQVFDQFDFSVNADFDEIVYDTYQLKGNKVVGRMTPNELKVQRLSGK